MDDQAGVGGHRQRALGLQVDVIGRTQADAALDHGRAVGPGRVHRSAGDDARRFDQLPAGGGLAGVQDRRQQLPVGVDETGRPPGRVRGFGDDEGERFPDAPHLGLGQQRLVVDQVAHVVRPGDVGGGEDGEYPWFCQCRCGLDAGEPGVGVRRGRRLGVQAAGRQGQVAGELGATRGEQGEIRTGHRRYPQKSKSG